MWDVTAISTSIVLTTTFLLTHPVWDVTPRELLTVKKLLIFLLTHPVWDVTPTLQITVSSRAFLLTHPVWDVTLTVGINANDIIISTHTSRVGCDLNP